MTPKQQRFVEEYLVDPNASAAARRAGYRGDPNTIGPRLLANVGVGAAIAAAQQERSERTKIDADWVLRMLAEEKSADLAAIYDEHGNLRPVHEWPMVFRRGLIVGVETVQERDGVDGDGNPNWVTVRKVKMTDRIKHLELIGKHVDVQAFREQRALTGPNGEPLALLSVDLSHLTVEQLRVLATLKLGDGTG